MDFRKAADPTSTPARPAATHAIGSAQAVRSIGSTISTTTNAVPPWVSRIAFRSVNRWSNSATCACSCTTLRKAEPQVIAAMAPAPASSVKEPPASVWEKGIHAQILTSPTTAVPPHDIAVAAMNGLFRFLGSRWAARYAGPPKSTDNASVEMEARMLQIANCPFGRNAAPINGRAKSGMALVTGPTAPFTICRTSKVRGLESEWAVTAGWIRRGFCPHSQLSAARQYRRPAGLPLLTLWA